MIFQEHGGNIYENETDIDFSVNTNPFGFPEKIVEAVVNSSSEWGKYPDHNHMELRNKISEYEVISPDNIVCGNGADDLIFRIVQAFRPKKCLITAPTFSEYEKAVSQNGGEITEYLLREEDDFMLKEDFTDHIGKETDMVFLCSPNNPTGRAVEPELLRKISDKCLENGVYLICDECFSDFTGDVKKYSIRSCMNERTIILKAFTKIFSMAGLRLGYAVCGDSSAAEKIHNTGQFWSVSHPAQKAGITALDEREYVKQSVRYVIREKAYLSEQLEKLGFRVFPSDANFILFYSRIPLYEKLLKEKILIRDCSNYSGLTEGYYRIGIRRHSENEILAETLRRLVNG